MNRTFEEWVERYNKKIPEGFKRDEKFVLFYLPDKGFCELCATDKMIVIGQVSGDGRFWKNFTENVARKLGFKACGTICGRKEFRAWIRLFGFKIDKVDEENGLKRYYCTGKNGGWYVMTEFIREGGRHECFVTWEVVSDGI